MSRRVRREVIEHHREHLQQVVSCVSTGVLTLGAPSRFDADDVRSFQLNGGANVSLSGSPLFLRMVQQFHIGQQLTGRAILVTGYAYTISHPSEGEIVSFQWHPGGLAGIDFPHVHIGPALSRHDSVVRAGEAHKIHLPTGQLSLADVVRLAIAEFGVEPRRNDWATVLEQANRPR